MAYKNKNKPFLYSKNGVYEINAGQLVNNSVYLKSGQLNLTLPIIDCSRSNSFKITITSSNLWRTVNVPKNCLYIFSLEIINGGLFTQTWFNNTKWDYGNVPVLTSSGTDILTFLTDDGGLTWYGVVTAKDLKAQNLYSIDYVL